MENLNPPGPKKMALMVERSAKEVGQEKNMTPGVLHHHQNGVLVVIATRRYGSWSNCNYNLNASKKRQTFHEPYTRLSIMVYHEMQHVPDSRASYSYQYHETSPQMIVK